MLRASFWILQMAYLLLQSGQQAKEAEEKAAKKRATRVSVSCQAALDEDMNKVLLEGGPLAKGLPECPIEKGPMKTQVICTSYASPPVETDLPNGASAHPVGERREEEEEELEESAESRKTAAIEATNKVALEEATRRAALVKAVLERAAQGEASRVEAVAKKKAAQERAAQVVAAIEAGLRRAPQTRKFLEEDLPRVSVPCQAGFEPRGAFKSRVRPPQMGLADALLLPRP